MQITELNSDAGFIQRIIEESRVEDPIAFDEDLPLNEENANRRLQYLDQMIAKASGEYSDFEIFGYTIEKLALHIYLENTAEAVACLRELNGLDDALFIEGETAHILLGWAVGDGVAKVMELAKFPDPISLLLLKAKGIPFPEPADFPLDDSFSGNKELEEQLFSRNYQEAIKILDGKLSELSLQTRGFCKAMLGDYEGALQDYNEVKVCCISHLSNVSESVSVSEFRRVPFFRCSETLAVPNIGGF